METEPHANKPPSMPDDLFILDPANQPFLLGTENLRFGDHILIVTGSIVIFPLYLMYIILTKPQSDGTINWNSIILIVTVL